MGIRLSKREEVFVCTMERVVDDIYVLLTNVVVCLWRSLPYIWEKREKYILLPSLLLTVCCSVYVYIYEFVSHV